MISLSLAKEKPESLVMTPVSVFVPFKFLEAVTGSLESMQRLLQSPGNHAHVVVAITEDVVAR